MLVLRNAGPKGAPGMPEAGYLPIPVKLARQGVRDMVRISDARMSGTAFGTVVLHIAPEAAVGGPLAIVRTGDPISLDVEARQLNPSSMPPRLNPASLPGEPPHPSAKSRSEATRSCSKIPSSRRTRVATSIFSSATALSRASRRDGDTLHLRIIEE